jgi:hypothetical protein
MTIVAEQFDFVVGIDTHARTHTLPIIHTTTGEELAAETFQQRQRESTGHCPGSHA